jgi:hypothetical protein
LLKLLVYVDCLVKHVLAKSFTDLESLRLYWFCGCRILNWNDMWIEMRKTRSDIRVSALNSSTASSAP